MASKNFGCRNRGLVAWIDVGYLGPRFLVTLTENIGTLEKNSLGSGVCTLGQFDKKRYTYLIGFLLASKPASWFKRISLGWKHKSVKIRSIFSGRFFQSLDSRSKRLYFLCVNHGRDCGLTRARESRGPGPPYDWKISPNISHFSWFLGFSSEKFLTTPLEREFSSV